MTSKKTKEGIAESATRNTQDEATELLRQAIDLVSHIQHQNDHTREFVRRATEFVGPSVETEQGDET